jgi:hypothetical protein
MGKTTETSRNLAHFFSFLPGVANCLILLAPPPPGITGTDHSKQGRVLLKEYLTVPLEGKTISPITTEYVSVSTFLVYLTMLSYIPT